jgi:glutaredoxin-related protein
VLTRLLCRCVVLSLQIKDNKLMVYMKGTPAAPACGFSMQVQPSSITVTFACEARAVVARRGARHHYEIRACST